MAIVEVHVHDLPIGMGGEVLMRASILVLRHIV